MKDYIKILRKQVDDEISYLVQHGHDTKHPPVACIFCHEFKGVNFCKRLTELRQFQSTLAVKDNTDFRKTAINPEINLPFLPDSIQHQDLPLIGHSN